MTRILFVDSRELFDLYGELTRKILATFLGEQYDITVTTEEQASCFLKSDFDLVIDRITGNEILSYQDREELSKYLESLRN